MDGDEYAIGTVCLSEVDLVWGGGLRFNPCELMALGLVGVAATGVKAEGGEVIGWKSLPAGSLSSQGDSVFE